MNHPLTWPEELNAIAGEQVQRHRRAHGWTAADLAERCAALGLPMSRSKVANLENGRARQEGIGIAELLVLGAALGVPPALLIFPIGEKVPVPILPGKPVDPWAAYLCFVGDLVDPALMPPNPNNPVPVYRQHTDAYLGYTTATRTNPTDPQAVDRHLTMLAAARVDMHRRGWTLPPIPPAVARALAEPLLGWGFTQDESGGLIDIRTSSATVPDWAPAEDPAPAGMTTGMTPATQGGDTAGGDER